MTHTCSVSGCSKPHVARGWCRTHYSQWQRHRCVDTDVRDPLPYGHPGERECRLSGCSELSHHAGWCVLHYNRIQRTGKPGPVYATKRKNSVRTFIRDSVERMYPEECLTDWSFNRIKGRPSCWDWENKRPVPAVHVAWRFKYGTWPSQLNHTCHDGLCWNVFHVYEGTQIENIRDMILAGRRKPVPIERRGRKLSESQVADIRSQSDGHLGEMKEFAYKYGVDRSVISRILSGEAYAPVAVESVASRV